MYRIVIHEGQLIKEKNGTDLLDSEGKRYKKLSNFADTESVPVKKYCC